MSLNNPTAHPTQQRSATVAHRGRKNHHRHHPNQSSSIQLGRPKGDTTTITTTASATLPRSRSLIKANSVSSNSSSSNGEDQQQQQQYQLGVINSRNIRIINNHINNNSSQQPNNELSSPHQHSNTMHKSVTIVATQQRSNSLDYLNFEEKRQLIASSLSLSELLHCGPAAVKEAAANGECGRRHWSFSSEFD